MHPSCFVLPSSGYLLFSGQVIASFKHAWLSFSPGAQLSQWEHPQAEFGLQIVVNSLSQGVVP